MSEVTERGDEASGAERTRHTADGKQRRRLRSLGHHLDPVVQLGKQGLTDGVVRAVDAALGTHELVKVRRGQDCPQDRHEIAEALDVALKAEVVQKLGRTILLYRPRPDVDPRPRIDLCGA
ncbi:MAG: ribosome assembly RNA-binding protein YhbY [Myxococcota bacterium]